MKTVIGLAGVKTSGKSTVANIIKKYVDNVHEAALADKLKNTCAEVFGLERKQFDLQELKEVPFDEPKIIGVYEIGAILESFGVYMSAREIDSKFNVVNMKLISPRHIAQIVGTEVLRAAGDEFIHCKNVPVSETGVTIISDVRFPNEYQYFSEAQDVNFIPIYIQRNEAEKHVTSESHASETSVFLFNDKCHFLPNNSSLQELESRILVLLSKHLEIKEPFSISS